MSVKSEESGLQLSAEGYIIHSPKTKHMKSRTLRFQSWQLFRQWYVSIKERFDKLKLVYMKQINSVVHIQITY